MSKNLFPDVFNRVRFWQVREPMHQALHFRKVIWYPMPSGHKIRVVGLGRPAIACQAEVLHRGQQLDHCFLSHLANCHHFPRNCVGRGDAKAWIHFVGEVAEARALHDRRPLAISNKPLRQCLLPNFLLL